ncbi:hypothetical protein HQ576_03420, partial [bacterium]|nr:hypothetical protein [bacterium]
MKSSVPERHLALLGLAAAAVLLLGGCGPRSARLDVAKVARKLGDRFTRVRHERIPPRALRGYGELAADFAVFEHKAGGQCSLLRIQCEDKAKAKVVHAKYVSDLHLLLPVKDEMVNVAGIAFPVVSVPDQGVIAAFRTGAGVTIAAATDVAQLTAALAAVSGSFVGVELTPTAKVPTYLDAWDKHGFRFYYRPFEPQPPKPGDKRIDWRDYNVLGEFDFARRNGEAGFIFWHNDEQCDFAEGLTNEQLWGYGARACAGRGLPVVVNSFIADSTWLVNRYRGQTQMKAPGYCGGFYTAGDAYHAGKGHLAWSAAEGRDAALSVFQNTWRRYAKLPTTIEYLEPHGELRHGEHDLLNEYGPQADKTFRAFLKETYGTLSAVSQRWHGRPDTLASWDDVRVPELAHFLGYGAAALDLGGDWRIQYEEFTDGKARPTNPAPEDWYLPACQDAAWPMVTAPQSDLAMFLPRRPAVWRRHFALPEGWRADKPKVWLYIFSLNRARQEPAPIYLNGRKVAEPVIGGIRNWTVAEVTDALREGENLLALRLPENFLGYRVYLTGQKPASYPYLGEQLNAQWADFVRWQAWVRQRAVRRGIEAIREVDPDRSIICMSPDSFISEVEGLCQDYGGRFHNTGYMAGWWAEPLPMMMRAADLPFSAEPGGPARDLPEFKRFLGNWLTEGVNAVHYFIHVGDVYWNDAIRTWFEENQAVVGAMGKMHVPKAEVAMLYGDDVENLTGWPWESARCGYVPYQLNVMFHKEYHMDGVSPRDFARGFADGYRVVIDTNTCIMDEKTVADIEAWVRRGGVFVTLGQTGRHTPEKADSWPISRLTGYRVTGTTRHPDQRVMAFAPGQPVFDEAGWDQKQLRRVGLLLEKADKDCTDLLLWPGKEVAVGMRQVGNGKVIQIGCEHNNSPLMLRQLLAWLKVRRILGYCDHGKVISTHHVSNNGLYDLWVAWNSEQKANTSDLVFREGLAPAYCIDLKTLEKLTPSVDGGTAKIANLSFGPGDIRILAAPRQS